MTQKNKPKKQWTPDPLDPFYGNKIRADKKRGRSHNTIPKKFRHKKTKANDKDQNP